MARARASAGQEATSNSLRAALAGSSRVDSATAASVQDPISFRVVPQVHGACRDVLAVLATNLGDELNATSDNPMVDIASERVLSNGNFHLMNVALSAESLNLALAHVGLLSERRCGQMWNSLVTAMGEGFGGEVSPKPPIGDGIPPFLAGMALRYPAATRYTRLRQLAQPISLDVPPLDLSVEDHSTNAAEVLWVTDEIVGIVHEILAVEVLLAFARLRISPGGSLGARTGVVVETVAEELDGLDDGNLPDETHVRVSRVLAGLVEEVLG
ncbi:MAG TPA: aromatic amino acid lyase [Acidimicrobiia bacterium]|nr:aromatic amino acid lyase [Acidimicrobiia bacterium]